MPALKSRQTRDTNIDIRGKNAILTGAGAGIGLGILRALAAEGVNLALTSRSPDPLAAATAKARAAGVEVFSSPGDVTDYPHVQEFVAAAIAQLGPIDLVINNAGVNTALRNLNDIPLETWRQVVDINLNGAYYVIREILPHLRANGGGQIINIVSGAGLRASAHSGVAYIASKHGVTGLSHAINVEEGENGIRCTAIYPGEVDTAMLDTDHQRLQPGEEGLVLAPEDVAAAVVFVAKSHRRALIEDLSLRPSRRRRS